MVDVPREHWPKPTDDRNVWDIRAKFNEFYDDVNADIFALVERRYHLKNPTYHPYCTWTVTTRYWGEDGAPLAIAHHYALPDGTFTKPDPKWLRVGDEIWKPDA